MDYNLAKQLKEAGFPQRGTGFNSDWFIETDEGKYYVPTLSELIEACGDEFRNLTKDNEIWSTNFIQGSEYDYGETEGKTPEEAVAKLYIKLNKKI